MQEGGGKPGQKARGRPSRMMRRGLGGEKPEGNRKKQKQ